MRKKYLSALLFGALLFASAGTFTSCKDYDDDINNLQEQINTVVSDLASLKSQIDNLGTGVSSVTFDEATGVLTVVDGEGTHTYTIKTTAGEVADVKITIEGQELKVNGETVGKVGDTVTVVNGELTVNGEGTGIKVGEYTILDNQDAGTVTITLPDADGKLQTVVLAKASSALTSLKFEDDATNFMGFTGEAAISWNVAATDVADWKGKKGAVKRNQLLVGQISSVNVQVTPASFDLGSAELSLQDSKGNPAPVKVSAVKNNLLLTRSSNSGSWMLSVEMTDDVTVDNIGSVFDAKNSTETNDVNILYALCVDGQPVSNYDIEIVTRREATNPTSAGWNHGRSFTDLEFVDEDGYKTSVKKEELPIGTTVLTPVFNGSTKADHLYDSYITFEGTNISLANSKGIVADGMTITAPASAAGTTITATVYFLDITGKQSKNTIEFTVAASTAESIAATPVDYKVMPAKVVVSEAIELADIEIKDLTSVFAKIDAATLEKAKQSGKLSIVEEKDQKGFFIASTDGTFNPAQYEFYKANGEDWDVTTDDLTELASIKFDMNDATNNKVANDAKPGTYDLYFVVKDEDNENEIIRVKMEVKVSVPAFTELFAQRNWVDGKYVARIAPKDAAGNWGEDDAVINLSSAYKAVSGTKADPSQLAFAFQALSEDAATKYPVTNLDAAYNSNQSNAVSGKAGEAILNKKVMYSKDGKSLAVSEISNMVAYTSVLAGLQDTQVETRTGLNGVESVKIIQEAFMVSSEAYTTKVETALNGVKPVYYVNGELQDADYVITLGADSNITPLNYNGTKPLDGFGLALNESVISAKCTLPNPSKFEFGGDKALDGYTVRVDPVSLMTEITDASLVQTISEGTITWGVGGDMTKGFEVTGLTVNKTATVNFILTDATGIEYPMSIEVIKK